MPVFILVVLAQSSGSGTDPGVIFFSLFALFAPELRV